jgi:hypothetical protein
MQEQEGEDMGIVIPVKDVETMARLVEEIRRADQIILTPVGDDGTTAPDTPVYVVEAEMVDTLIEAVSAFTDRSVIVVRDEEDIPGVVNPWERD